MPGQTPTFGFPFPSSGDPIKNGAKTFEAFARAVENKLRTIAGVPLAERVAPDPYTLILRYDDGRAQVAKPVAALDAVNKAHLDGIVNGLTFKVSASAPPAGTPATTITFKTG
jgi:hypothetical protein